MPDLTAGARGARHLRVVPAPAGHSPLEHVNDLLRVLVQGVDPDEWALVTAPASKAGCKRLVLSDELDDNPSLDRETYIEGLNELPEVTGRQLSLFPRRP
jgi:hypothetical protein